MEGQVLRKFRTVCTTPLAFIGMKIHLPDIIYRFENPSQFSQQTTHFSQKRDLTIVRILVGYTIYNKGTYLHHFFAICKPIRCSTMNWNVYHHIQNTIVIHNKLNTCNQLKHTRLRIKTAIVVTHFSTNFLSNSDSVFLISKRLAHLLRLFHAIKTCFFDPLSRSHNSVCHHC